MSKSVNIDDITDLKIEELNKVDLYSQIKHRVEQENHWEAQRRSMENQKWYWLGTIVITAILGVAALYFK